MEGTSLGIFPVESVFRQKIHWFVTYPAFDIVIDLIIVASCVVLIFETPEESDNQTFKTLNKVFTAIFVMEMALKVIALGMLPYPLLAQSIWTSVADDDATTYSSCEYLTLAALKRVHQLDPVPLTPLSLHTRGLITNIKISKTGTVVLEWQTMKSLRLVFKKTELVALYFLKEPGLHVEGFVDDNEEINTEIKLSWHKWKL